MPKDSHLGQLDIDILASALPEQFLTEYNYDFVYRLRCDVIKWRSIVQQNTQITVHSVMDKLILYLIIDAAAFLMDTCEFNMIRDKIKGINDWKEWIYYISGDVDVVTCLYSDQYLTKEHCYHFDHWYKEQFHMFD